MRLRLDLRLRVPRGLLLEAKIDSTATCWGLSGPSGSGKTSLLRAIAGVDAPAGTIQIDDETWGATLPTWQRRIGWAPQDGALFPHLSVRQNLLFGETPNRPGPSIAEVADRLGLTTHLDRQPRHLSGGEKQRVALGRALLSSPLLLLLDEPVSALDRPLRLQTMAYLREAMAQWKLSAIIVSHDARDLEPLVDGWLEVSEGRLHVR